MSHPFIGGVIAVVANKLADEYVKKKGAHWFGYWGSVMVWSCFTAPTIMLIGWPFRPEEVGNAYTMSNLAIGHLVTFLGLGIIGVYVVWGQGPGQPPPWRARLWFWSWWLGLVFLWTLWVGIMVLIGWLGEQAGYQAFFPVAIFTHNAPMNNAQVGAFYGLFWLAFGVNVLAWRYAGKRMSQQQDALKN
jgi:hypothetical protein